jgi:hypothetical protein
MVVGGAYPRALLPQTTAGPPPPASDTASVAGAAPGTPTAPGATGAPIGDSIRAPVTQASTLADTGTTVYTLEPEESDDVKAAIDRTASHTNFIIRPIVRRRLTRNNRLPQHVTFAVSPDTITVTFDGTNPIVTPRNGDSVAWTRVATRDTHTERYTVHIRQAGDTLRQTIVTDDGGRNNEFVFLDGGAEMRMHVRLWADRLPVPLMYSLAFRRSS